MKGEMRIMGTFTGDERVAWDTERVETVDAAKQRFAEELFEGRLAFADGALVKEFDAFAQKIVVTPALAGG